MQWSEIQKDWTNFSKSFRTKWPKLSNEDIQAIAGKRDVLIERLNRHYDLEPKALERQVDEFVETLKPMKV